MTKTLLFGLTLLISVFSHATAILAYQKIRPLIFQIKTAANSAMEKTSYGTGFVIDKSGLLITNYHVVADSIWTPESLKVFAIIDKKSIEAKILNIDYVNDLALLKVDYQFTDQIKIAAQQPEKGSEIFSLGLPHDIDWTVVSGIYNGIVKEGPLDIFYMSTPINPGMSGGPTVNLKSELIAVNASLISGSQQISFGVSLNAIKKIIEKKSEQQVKTTEQLIEILRVQLTELQDHMTESLLKSIENDKKIDGVSVPTMAEWLKCWGESSSEKDNLFNRNGESCTYNHSVRLESSVMEGFVSSDFTVAKNVELNRFAFQRVKSTGWNGFYPGMVFSFNENYKFNFSRPKCIRENIQHPGSMLRVGICFQKILPLTGLYDAYIILQKDLGKDKVVRGKISLAGFTKKNITAIMKAMLSKKYEVAL